MFGITVVWYYCFDLIMLLWSVFKMPFAMFHACLMLRLFLMHGQTYMVHLHPLDAQVLLCFVYLLSVNCLAPFFNINLFGIN